MTLAKFEGRTMARYRTHSIEFKRHIAQEYPPGRKGVESICFFGTRYRSPGVAGFVAMLARRGTGE
jgi:hypothetical protein